MTAHEPGQSISDIYGVSGNVGNVSEGMGGASGAHDALAARLIAAHRLLAGLTADPEVRIRLQLRFAAICTALKLPGASEVRGASRLDRLMTDARHAQNEH